MSSPKKSKPPELTEARAPKSTGTDDISVNAWKNAEKRLRRDFPGPREARALLRVAVDRSAYAELIAHAKESLEKEICGVLAGKICEDNSGPFVHVGAVIRGAAAAHGSTHVTFTQETWQHVHTTLERDFPDLQIVGWYHSHPGFGVQFSEMDLFIQKNFFSGPTQIALVIDPMSGAVAICLNTPEGIQYIDRFWVDGREQTCQVPAQPSNPSTAVPPANLPPSPTGERAGEALEARLGQLIQALDEQRASYYRFLLFIGLVVCLGVAFWIGYTLYSNYRYRNEPPQLNQFVPVPIQVGDKTILVGIAVAQWQVPAELNATLIAIEKEKQKLAEKAAMAQTNQGAGTSSTTNSATNTPAP